MKINNINKKGQSLNTASLVVMGIVGFVIFIVVGLLFLNFLIDAKFVDDNRPSFTTRNEYNGVTTVFINQTGYTLASANATTGSYVITAIKNATTNGLGFYNFTILIPNVSITSAGLIRNTSTLDWRNVSINYTFTDQTPNTYLTENIRTNVSTGLFLVVDQFPTVFTVIALIIVLAIITVLVIVIRRSGFGTMAGGNFGQ